MDSAAGVGRYRYAAVVATLAFGWNILRWYKERPKLDITLIPDAELVTPVGSEADLLGVKVVNLGGTSTTIESVSLAEFTTFDRPWLATE